MKLKKPKFWDYERPNLLSYILLPLTFPIIINNFLLSLKKDTKEKYKIKKICIGNIYIGGSGKTPLTVKIYQILNDLKIKTGTIKNFIKIIMMNKKCFLKKLFFIVKRLELMHLTRQFKII